MAIFYEQGRYLVRITNQVLTENKKGNPELQLTIKPLAVYEQGNDEPQFLEFPYERTLFFTLTEATIGTASKPGWVLETLRFLGFQATSFGALDPSHPEHVSFVNNTHDAICQHEAYEGKDRERWNLWRGERPPAAPIAREGIRKLDAMFGNVLKATTSPKTTRPPTPESGLPDQGPRDDSIPF